MPGSGARAGPDGVHPELCGEVTGNRKVNSGERLSLAAHVRPFREVGKLAMDKPSRCPFEARVINKAALPSRCGQAIEPGLPATRGA